MLQDWSNLAQVIGALAVVISQPSDAANRSPAYYLTWYDI